MAKSLTSHFNLASFQKVVNNPHIEEVKFWCQNHSALWLLLKTGKKTAGECILKNLKVFPIMCFCLFAGHPTKRGFRLWTLPVLVF